MQHLKRFIPFKYKICLLLFVTVLFVSSFLGTFQFIIMRKSLRDGYEQNKESINDRVINMVSNADYVNMLLERPLETSSKQLLQSIDSYYKETGTIDFDYNTFLEGSSNVEFYVIDNANTVVSSSNHNEIGLTFSDYPDFIKFLDNIRSSKQFTTSRITLSILGNNLMKYCYLPSYDGKYIFETGSLVEYDKGYFSGLGFDDIEESILSKYDFVDSILLYDYKGVSYKKDETGNPLKVSPYYRANFDESISTLQQTSVTGIYNGKKANYTYIPYEIINARGSNERNVIEIVYNERVLERNLAYNMHIIILFVTIGATCAASIGYYFSKVLTRPIQDFTNGILSIANGNLSYRFSNYANDEFSILGNHFNDMTSKIENLLVERYRYEKDLHTKNQEVLAQKEEITALYEETIALNSELELSLKRNHDSYFETVRALANAIEEKDAYTGGHCERVMSYSLLIAKELKLTESEMEDIKFGSILHDIGKIGISEHILNKNARLTDEEYAIIQTHPERGSHILNGLNFMKNCSRIVSEHHERIDGKGYPNGLKGEEIDLLARIVCVADAFDAMTSERSYRRDTLTKEEALQELVDCSGTQFDCTIVEAFIKALK